jgi:metal transporter CNNM
MASPADSLLLTNVIVWIGMVLCITQSAILSGQPRKFSELANYGWGSRRQGGNRDASGLLTLRKDSNLTLAMVLRGNVTTNVLLTLLSDSVLAGIRAFAFSTIVITLFGETIPLRRL